MRFFCIVVLFMSVFLVGCSISGYSTKHNSQTYQQYDISDYQMAKVITERIQQANELFKQGDFRSAALVYHGLLREYRSLDSAFECAVRTNLCLTNLEEGDRQSFKENALKLTHECKSLETLSRETQFVLYLNEMLSDSNVKRVDLRIEPKIVNNLDDIFKFKGGE